MISHFQPTKVCILLVVSCLAWIGVISLGVVFLVGAAALTGWIVAGVLVLLVAGGFFAIARSIRNAIEMPDADPLLSASRGAEKWIPTGRGFRPAQPRETAAVRRMDRPHRRASR